MNTTKKNKMKMNTTNANAEWRIKEFEDSAKYTTNWQE